MKTKALFNTLLDCICTVEEYGKAHLLKSYLTGNKGAKSRV
jgi:hypothetical protein